ncbi:hypothetical protein [Zeaxanthinibacter enoshimensis]|uniref:Phenylalanyl-tRNA synthetase subunit alpha n=1 Tax=Zeaxanthinibacter enoshimensis TaxID=392009 RepID=A0A4R6TN50_9FLAO|nr:hypothetical protein [Zeaxanthinibacter enoshimensis]TDQ32934.1 hypothetical protein CLV82_0772 [Zeaxanthinibacter enoshimensis]
MRKDIEIPIAKDVHVALAHDWDEEFLSRDWNAYLINNRNSAIEMVLIVSKGYDGETKTSTMRHAIGVIEARSFAKIELVQEEVLQLENEFFVTFYAEGKLFERKYIFRKNSIGEQELQYLPILEKEGLLGS